MDAFLRFEHFPYEEQVRDTRSGIISILIIMFSCETFINLLLYNWQLHSFPVCSGKFEIYIFFAGGGLEEYVWVEIN